MYNFLCLVGPGRENKKALYITRVFFDKIGAGDLVTKMCKISGNARYIVEVQVYVCGDLVSPSVVKRLTI